MAKNLRDYLEKLEENHPDEFIRVTEPINPSRHEIAAYLKLMEDRGKLPVTLFQNVKNQKGVSSQFPLVHNIFATRPFCAMALNLDPSQYRMELVNRFAELEINPADYNIIPQSDAPVMQNVWEGERADINLLPAARYHGRDAGNYFVMANVLKGKSGNFYDVTMAKNMVQGPQKMSISATGHRHLARIISEYEEVGEPAPAAVILGHHPAFYLGACSLTEYGNNDYHTISSFLGESLRLVPSASLGDDFLIPADAEIVIEGIVIPGVRESQNPFGEITGHYQEEKMFPVIEVKAICFRNDAIMEGILPSHPEHFNLGGVSKEGSVFNAIKRVVPDVTAIYMPGSSSSRFSSYISLKKKTSRDVQVAAMIALAEMPNHKMVVVVDNDIDVFNEQEVLWAIITQTRWDKDIRVIPGVQTVRKWLGDAVVIIDATRPEEVTDFPDRNRIPEDAINRIRQMLKK